MQYAWLNLIHLRKIMKVELKCFIVASGELSVLHIDGVLSIHVLCVKSWAIQIPGRAQIIQLMALEAQASQFGWRMFTAVELKNHWLIATTIGGGATITATIPVMWVCLVWTVSVSVQ